MCRTIAKPMPVPLMPCQHVSRISFYIWPGVEVGSAQEDALRGIGQAFASIIRDEDYVVAASQQRAANDGSLEHVVFGRNEPALHHYHSTYRAALGMPSLPLVADGDAF